MKLNTYTLVTLAAILLSVGHIQAQGCVAIRHFSTCSGHSANSAFLPEGNWLVGANYRYFKSFRHFRGHEEEPDRVANGTEVINNSHSLDMNFSYGISDRLFAALTLPFVVNVRSSLYEHGRTERHASFSRGLADARIGLGYWLLSPEKSGGTNMAIGLGLKIPTGNYNATDIFYNVGPNGEPQVRPVDQSIQPGDGGLGVTLDFQFYQRIAQSMFFYAGGFYLLNPLETNGIRTFRETLSPVLANEAIMSVPDQFSLRGGISYGVNTSGLEISLGARYEGVPVEDLIGGSEGFRRPGQVLSFEPGIGYMKNNVSFNLSVPVAVYRNRPQSVTDLETERATGQPRNGDAAFADYLINFSITKRLAPKTQMTPSWDGLNKN